jgi:L-ascorbate metabolism protein UlaG (beta-lactamase superfamily)
MSPTSRRIVRSVIVASLFLVSCRGTLAAPLPPPRTPDPASWSDRDLTIAWLGHATVLIDFAGTRILTDPALFDRVGLSIGPLTIGPKRIVAAALAPGALPALDAITVSHAHMDSLDRPSLAAIAPKPLLVVPGETRDLVDDLGYAQTRELAWGEEASVGGVSIEAIEVKHWGRRWPWDGWRGYNGYLFRRGGVAVLFASDTAYSRELAAFARRRGVDVMILGIGAYDPWIRNHESPEEAWRTFEESGARYLVPIHWDTFRLGKEPLGEAMRRLLAAAGARADRIVVRQIGDTWSMKLTPSD